MICHDLSHDERNNSKCHVHYIIHTLELCVMLIKKGLLLVLLLSTLYAVWFQFTMMLCLWFAVSADSIEKRDTWSSLQSEKAAWVDEEITLDGIMMMRPRSQWKNN